MGDRRRTEIPVNALMSTPGPRRSPRRGRLRCSTSRMQTRNRSWATSPMRGVPATVERWSRPEPESRQARLRWRQVVSSRWSPLEGHQLVALRGLPVYTQGAANTRHVRRVRKVVVGWTSPTSCFCYSRSGHAARSTPALTQGPASPLSTELVHGSQPGGDTVPTSELVPATHRPKLIAGRIKSSVGKRRSCSAQLTRRSRWVVSSPRHAASLRHCERGSVTPPGHLTRTLCRTLLTSRDASRLVSR